MNSAPDPIESPTKDVHGEGLLHPEDTQPAGNQPSSSSSSSSPHLLDVELPQSELDLTMTFESIMSEAVRNANPEVEVVQKRASNVFKLTQENEKLKEELRAMTERLEAAERKQRELKLKAARFKEGEGTS
ncbi:hypothetical protein B0H21DRAFT_8352 [Amylocystis lapponica]|nr:hypothetical protein B0H21DRAFT_8352 [Amylocystis lapponica]